MTSSASLGLPDYFSVQLSGLAASTTYKFMYYVV
jgi:hypothetical protein